MLQVTFEPVDLVFLSWQYNNCRSIVLVHIRNHLLESCGLSCSELHRAEEDLHAAVAAHLSWNLWASSWMSRKQIVAAVSEVLFKALQELSCHHSIFAKVFLATLSTIADALRCCCECAGSGEAGS